MKSTPIKTGILAVMLTALIAAPAVAQTTVSARSPSFEWTGKSGQQAGYDWSATVDNPSGRELRVRVTFEMLDAEGNVVATDSTDLTVGKETTESIQRSASASVSVAETATEYRVTIVGLG